MIDTAKKYIQVFPKIRMVADARDAYHKVLYKLQMQSIAFNCPSNMERVIEAIMS